MDKTEMILSIADGTQSVSRIKRIVIAAYVIELTHDEILGVTTSAGIATPKRVISGNELKDRYPDRWSILMEARTFWARVRRYWGDNAAAELYEAIEDASDFQWRGLVVQFPGYVDSMIYDRTAINLQAERLEPTELESLYDWEMQRELYLQACKRELEQNPEFVPGVKHPLPTAEYEAEKQAIFEKKCLFAYDAMFSDDMEMITHFAKFWQAVRQKRGERYAEELCKNLAGFTGSGFYSATESNFRHFLFHLEEFKWKSPHRIVKLREAPPLSMYLEGALLKHGWEKLHSFVLMGFMCPLS